MALSADLDIIREGRVKNTPNADVDETSNASASLHHGDWDDICWVGVRYNGVLDEPRMSTEDPSFVYARAFAMCE